MWTFDYKNLVIQNDCINFLFYKKVWVKVFLTKIELKNIKQMFLRLKT